MFLLGDISLCRIAPFIGVTRGKSSEMATSRSKILPVNVLLGKRVRLDTATNNSFSGSNDPASPVSEVDMEPVSIGNRSRKVPSALELHPLPGFEPPPFRGHFEQKIQENDAQLSFVEEKATFRIVEGGIKLTQEQKMRIELNKGIAQARRNLKMCEAHVDESQRQGKSFPELKDLLVEQSWLDVLNDEFAKQYMIGLNTFVQQEAAGKLPIYPPPAKLFNAFHCCPFNKVKVVIIGQDPYHGPGQAMGLCFSVPKGVKIPSSLSNMFKEIVSDVGGEVPHHGNLEKWAHQGVLLLNTVMTVREHHANSHAKKGWEPFTDATIRAVSQHHKGIVFLLWGNSAQEKTRLIDCKKHHVLKAAHPSGLSANKGFFKCRHFSKTNDILEKAGNLPIDWQL